MGSTTEPMETFKRYPLKHTLTGHDCSVSTFKFSDDGRSSPPAPPTRPPALTLLSSIDTPHHQFHGHDFSISDCAFSSDGRFLATASDDRTVRLWDVATGAHIKTLAGHTIGYPRLSEMVDREEDEMPRISNQFLYSVRDGYNWNFLIYNCILFK